MPTLGRDARRPIFAAICLVVAITLLLSTAAAQAAPIPPGSGSNTAPVSPIPQSQKGTTATEPAAPTGVTIAITDPSQIPNRTVYDFSDDAEFSTPSGFPAGVFSGAGEVRITGSSWGTWNPNVPGIHVLFASSGSLEIVFNDPQQGVGVVAEPNNFGSYTMTMEGFDSNGAYLDLLYMTIDGNAGAAFFGLLSDQPNIKRVVITSDPNAAGFAFTNVTWGSGAVSRPWGWVFYDKNRDGWRNAAESYSGLGGAQIRVTQSDETVQTLHTWAPSGFYELTWEPLRPYCVTLDLGIQFEATTPTTKCVVGEWDWVPSFGVVPYTGMLDGRIYRDWNGSGTWDAGDAAIADVALELWLDGDASGPKLRTTTTADGNYAFQMLPAGTYSVKVATTGGPLAALATPQNPKTSIALGGGGHVSGIDFPYRTTCKGGRSIITGRVWRDADGDQVEGAAETGIPNVQVCAEPFGWVVGQRCARSDAQGRFDLCVYDARHLLTVTPGAGLTVTTPDFQFVDTPGAPYVHFGYR